MATDARSALDGLMSTAADLAPGTALEAVPAESSISVREIHRTPEQDLVREFYRLWTDHPDQRPTGADLALAKRLLAKYGRTQAQALLPLAVQQLKQHWPGAKTFVAVEQYISEAVEQAQRQTQIETQRRRQTEQERIETQELERQQMAQQQFETHWQPMWEHLSVGEQEAIRNDLLRTYTLLRHAPHQWHLRCLQELARRNAEEGDAPVMGESA